MNYSDITSDFTLYANVMNTIYVKQTEDQIFSASAYNDVMTLLADGAFQTLFTPFENLIRPFIDSEKLNYDAKISDLNNYANDLYVNGRTISIINDFNTYRNLNHFLEVENMYQLYYILEYYQEMTDTTLPTCWIHTPERFAVVNDPAHKYFEDQTINLLNSL